MMKTRWSVLSWLLLGAVFNGCGSDGSSGKGLTYQQQNQTPGGYTLGQPLLVAYDEKYSAQYPSVAIDKDGKAMVAWRQVLTSSSALATIVASRYQPGSGWQAASTLSPASISAVATAPSVEVDRAGNFWAAWSQGENGDRHAFYAARFDASGNRWETAIKIDEIQNQPGSPPAKGNFGGLGNSHFAFDDQGNALLFYAKQTKITVPYAYSLFLRRYLVAQGQWGAAETVGNEASGDMNIAALPGGDALLVWLDSGGNLWSRRYLASNGALEASPSAPLFTGVSPQHLAINASGQGWLAFGQGKELRASRYDPVSATFATPQTVANGIAAVKPQLAINDSGTGFIGFLNDKSGAFIEWESAAVRFDSAADQWEAAQVLDGGLGNNPYASPEIAVDAAGNALAAWQMYNGQHNALSNLYRAGKGWQGVQYLETGYQGVYERVHAVMSPQAGGLAVWDQDYLGQVSIFASLVQ